MLIPLATEIIATIENNGAASVISNSRLITTASGAFDKENESTSMHILPSVELISQLNRSNLT